jgi:hypothetical protein
MTGMGRCAVGSGHRAEGFLAHCRLCPSRHGNPDAAGQLAIYIAALASAESQRLETPASLEDRTRGGYSATAGVSPSVKRNKLRLGEDGSALGTAGRSRSERHGDEIRWMRQEKTAPAAGWNRNNPMNNGYGSAVAAGWKLSSTW